MICIEEYLQTIFKDFENTTKEKTINEKLCNDKKLTYEQQYELPDYTDDYIQKLYLLRYAYAYVFKYATMYLDKVLDNINNKDSISVTSLGCGSGLDYWGLVYALEKKQLFDTKIRYSGFDKVAWKYKICEKKGKSFTSDMYSLEREQDTVLYSEENVVECFQKYNKFTSDIYLFPQSISEFSDEDLKTIANNFSSKEINQDTFFLCISFRGNREDVLKEDTKKIIPLIEAIKQNGFLPDDDNYDSIPPAPKDEAIKYSQYSNGCGYSENIKDFLGSLNDNCQNSKNCSNDTCKIARKPMLSEKYVRYKVIRFDRKV